MDTVVLALDSSFRLTLNNIFYVPDFRRNLISLSSLDNVGYCFNFVNRRVDLIYDSRIVRNCVLTNGLYRLSLSSHEPYYSFNVESSVAKRSFIKERSSLLWHKRLRHISKEMIEKLIKTDILPPLESDNAEICIDCVRGKLNMTKKKGLIAVKNC